MVKIRRMMMMMNYFDFDEYKCIFNSIDSYYFLCLGSKKAFIFMIPRYYRGINDDEELVSKAILMMLILIMIIMLKLMLS